MIVACKYETPCIRKTKTSSQSINYQTRVFFNFYHSLINNGVIKVFSLSETPYIQCQLSLVIKTVRIYKKSIELIH